MTNIASPAELDPAEFSDVAFFEIVERPMALGENVSGMLNLAAMSVAFSAAYVGWDKVNLTDELYKTLQDNAREVVKDTKLTLHTFGMTPDRAPNDLRWPFAIEFYLYVLSRVAGLCQPWTWRTPLYASWSLLYVPPIEFIRSKRDRMVAITLTMMSLALFLLMTAATVWSIPLIDTPAAAKTIFWTLSLSLWLSIIMNILASRIKHLRQDTNLVVDRLNRAMSQLTKRLSWYLEAGTDVPPAASTSTDLQT